jgi:hypothetical protein
LLKRFDMCSASECRNYTERGLDRLQRVFETGFTVRAKGWADMKKEGADTPRLQESGVTYCLLVT